ncbi:hypothetical protein [Allokutzneria albata]|uniref:Uncharacterized protein n=1 Tax=Allokutzneria albata TaxID=211114 RepID=A0A1G9R814_ALLAB|nr:hypothetical protein [Allokutzneria albata]SDM19373.1 hypothetical protein SAMN04489726_0287 [Allokutzneria albata]
MSYVVPLLVVSVLAVVLVGSPGDGAKWLRRWGVLRPTEDDVRSATAHLRRRNATYVAVWCVCVVATIAFGEIPGITNDIVLRLWFPVASGLLLGEVLMAMRRQKGAVRRASLVPRRREDLVPLWATVLEVALFTATVTASLTSTGDLAVSLGGAVLAVGLVETTIRLAVLRVPAGEAKVDMAMRLASCRMALGAGYVLLGCFLAARVSPWVPGLPVVVLLVGTALACVVVIYLPPRRTPEATG